MLKALEELLEEAQPELKGIVIHSNNSYSAKGERLKEKKYHIRQTIYTTGTTPRSALIKFIKKRDNIAQNK